MFKIKMKYIPRITFKQAIALTAVLILTIAVVLFGLEFIKTRRELNKLRNPFYLSQLQSELSDQTLETLEKIMLLPEGEPSIVNIVDVGALQKENPEFYKNATNGDILIIYPAVAVILRVEDENKPRIINVAPVMQQQTAPTPEVQ